MRVEQSFLWVTASLLPSDLTLRPVARRARLFQLTNVNPSKQKLLGMKHKGA